MRLVLIVALMSGFIAGCGGEAVPSTAPVTGIVIYRDKPVEGATVSLVPVKDGGWPATGVTDAEGKFSVGTFLTSSRVEGAVPGEYRVAVMKRSEGAAPPAGLSQFELKDWVAQNPPAKGLLPRKYSDAAKSGLGVTVKAEGNLDVKLELKD